MGNRKTAKPENRKTEKQQNRKIMQADRAARERNFSVCPSVPLFLGDREEIKNSIKMRWNCLNKNKNTITAVFYTKKQLTIKKKQV